MAISRRQFFRGIVGQSEDRVQEHRRRIEAVEAYVRANLFPYDFALTGEQAEQVLASAVAGVDLELEVDPLTDENRTRLRETAETMIQRWRDEHLRAEDVRRDALTFVPEFLSAEATPEQIEKLRERYHLPVSTGLQNDIEREIRVWLGGLPNSRLAGCQAPELRELVLSELRSWC